MVVWGLGFWGLGLSSGFLDWGFQLTGFGDCSLGPSWFFVVGLFYLNMEE